MAEAKPTAAQKAPAAFDGIAVAETETEAQCPKPHHRFWGSARMSYTICAFLAMVLHLCMRNTLNFVILCMVKLDPAEVAASGGANTNPLLPEEHQCGAPLEWTANSSSSSSDASMHRTGDLLWTRSQEFTMQGTFYYGYLITLPIAGRLADKFGGKLFFVHSITAQAVVFMLMPIFARIDYWAVVGIRVLQGLIAGCGNPALYMLFATWAHPTERTALLSFAFGGYAVGALLIFPISSFLCQFGWETAFYAVGGVSLLFGISFQWLIYSSLEEHPRISRAEYDYLKAANEEKSKESTVPWKSIFSSVPVYAFALTHICHSYGIIVITLMIPRFFQEAMQFPLSQVGLYSSAPFLGSFISKAITIASCSLIEKRPNLNLTRFRRIVYVVCNCATVLLLLGIIAANCRQRIVVVLLTMCIGVVTDLAFSGAYWPSLLYVAPAYAGLLSGISNCLATFSGFLAPLGISSLVLHGTQSEWDYVLLTLVAAYGLGALIYGCFGSSELQHWGRGSNNNNKNNNKKDNNSSSRENNNNSNAT